jgi:NADH:ubiquinone oxidoreductase subunit 5 (subunit L)/multisubunit Na+/H+ antiporter MnhA subunit
MYISIILIPFVSSILCGLFGRFIGTRGTQLLSTTLIFTSVILSFIIFYEVGLSTSPVYIKLTPWIFSSYLTVSWGFLFDSLTAVMLIVVTFISALVHMYSIGYMNSDPHVPRFMSFLYVNISNSR